MKGTAVVCAGMICCALHGPVVVPMNTDKAPAQPASVMSTEDRAFFVLQVVGAVGWGNARLPIPSDIAPELQELLEECWDEPTERPGFEGVLNVLKKLVAQPNFVFQSLSADDGGASQDLSRPVMGL